MSEEKLVKRVTVELYKKKRKNTYEIFRGSLSLCLKRIRMTCILTVSLFVAFTPHWGTRPGGGNLLAWYRGPPNGRCRTSGANKT